MLRLGKDVPSGTTCCENHDLAHAGILILTGTSFSIESEQALFCNCRVDGRGDFVVTLSKRR